MPQIQDMTVGLRFTADISAARQQLNELKTTLSSLSNLSTVDFNKSGLTAGINEATAAAGKLKIQLEEATNVKTGNLDLSKFSRSLKDSGMTLDQYKKKLEALGPSGEQAFYQLAGAIQSAEVPLIKTNKLFGNLWENLKRTAGWQISSSMIHGFMGAIQKAYGYAQDLNKSLNDIRIVTGASVDKMAQFADQANRSAKALSTSTNEYVKASLIYYQQGLDDEAVKERTDVTVKMANVTGESAQTVSDQMTAVWNNFAKGSETIESFADKMVALGAETASSSDEIARGLEKFAAVADTVGLSFDYAAAALTTITATTRQSADTVGTALKTLFARMEGLKLGETLEDGTDLNKYSEALASIGVNIKDANGELKSMDAILDETMVKWKTLSKDQQVALAQTVAGVRQYTQFVALMDSSDFFKENLMTEQNASGALQKQADIYAESWEGAQKRVKASMETLYQTLINDEFFIKVTNTIAKILDGIGAIVKSMGGAKGVLAGITALVFRLFSNQIADGIRNITFSVENFISGGKKALALKQEMSKLAQEQWGNEINSEASMAMGEGYRRIADLQAIIASRADQMSQAELRENQLLIDRQKYLEDTIQKQAQLVDKIREEVKVEQEVIKEQIESTNYDRTDGDRLKTLFGLKNAAGEDQTLNSTAAEGMAKIVKSTLGEESMGALGIDEATSAVEVLEKVAAAAEDGSLSLEQYQNILAQVTTAFDGYSQAQGNMVAAQDQLNSVLTDETASWQDVEAAQTAAIKAEQDMVAAAQAAGVAIEGNIEVTEKLTEADWKQMTAEERSKKASELRNKQLQAQESIRRQGTSTIGRYTKAISQDTKAENENRKALTNHAKALQNTGKQTSILSRMQATASKQFQNFKNAVSQATVKIADYAAHAVKVVQGTSQIAMGLSSLHSFWDNLKNSDMSFFEKLSSSLMSLGMGLPMVINGFKTLKPEILGAGQAIAVHNAAEDVFLASKDKEIAKMTLSTALHKLKTGAIKGEEAEKVKDAVVQTIANKLAQDENGNLTKNIVLKNGKTIATAGESAATAALNIVQAILNGELTITEALLGVLNIDMLTVIATIAIVIAAIAALVAIIWLVVAAFQAQDKEMKAAANETQKAAQAAIDAKNQYENLKTAIEELKSSEDTLKGLTKGTTEWKEAVLKLNEQVLTLLKTYPELAKYITNSDGVLGISDEGLDMILEKQLAGVEAAQQYASAAALTEERLKQKNKKDDNSILIKSKTKSSSDLSDYMKANDIKGSRHLDIPTEYGNVGFDYGKSAFTEGQLRGIFESYQKNQGSLTREDISKYLQNPNSITKSQWDGLITHLTTLCNSLDANTTAQKVQTDNMVRNANKDAYNDGTEEQHELFTDFMTKRITDQGDNRDVWSQEYKKEGHDKDVTKWNDAEVWDEYEKMLNATIDGFTYAVDNKAGSNATVTRVNNATDQKEWLQNDGTYSTTENKNAMGQKRAYETVKTYKNASATEADITAFNQMMEDMGDIMAGWDGSVASLDEYRQKLSEVSGANMEIANDFIDATDSMAAAKNAASNNMQSVIDAMTSMGNVSQDVANTQVQDLVKSIEGSEEDLTIFGQFEFDPNSKQTLMEQYNRFKREFEEEQKENAIQLEAELGESEGLDAEKVSDYVQNLMDIADESEILEDALMDDAKAAGVVARSVMHMNDGIDELADNQEEWLSILQNSSETSEEFASALGGIRRAMSKILDIDGSYLSKDFLTNAENLELMKKAAEGDAEAIDALKKKLQDEVIMKVIADNEIENSDALLARHSELKSILENDKIKIGATIDDSEFLEKAQALIDEAGMTTEQAQAYFDSLGYEAEIEQETVDLPKTTQETHITPKLVWSDVHWGGDVIGGNIKIPTLDFVVSNKEVPATEEITAASLGPAGKTTKPKIKGVTKKATGSMNNYSSSNAGGGSPGTSKSGGSKSGSGKDKTPKKLADEIDRYHEINEVLDDLSKKLDKIDTIKDRAFGGKHLAAIDAEIAALQEEEIALDEKIRQAEQYLQEDAAKINAYGAQYDEAGRVINYNEIIANAVAAYNSGSIDDDEFSYIKDALSKYEDSLNTLEDVTEQKAENIRKQLDAKFEKVEYKIEIHLDINEKERKYIDWQLSHLEDREFAGAERIGLNSLKADLAFNDWETNEKGIREILEAAGASSAQIDDYIAGNIDSIKDLDNLTTQAIEDLGEYTQGLMDSYDKMADAKKAIEEELTATWELYNEKLEDTMAIYDHLEKKVSHYQNIVDLAGKKALGVTNATMRAMRQAQIEIARGNAESLRDQLSYNESSLANAEAQLTELTKKYEEATGTEKEYFAQDKKYWEDQVKNIKSKTQEIQETLWETEESIIEKLKEDWEATVNEMMDEFEEGLSGTYKSFDELSEAFDQQKTLAAQYLPDYQRLYELSKLNRQLNKDLEKVDSTRGKEKLKELQEEINALQADGVQMSQYDLEYLQKKYDLKMAEIALEDAQDAKNMVRLRRDANGNYGYVYTADEDKTNDAVQNYEDKLYAAQDLTEKYITEMGEQYIATLQEMSEAIRAIQVSDYASYEDYQAKVNQVRDYYTQRLKFFSDEVDGALQNNIDLYKTDYLEYETKAGLKENRGEAFVTHFSETVIGQVIGEYDRLGEHYDKVLEQLGDVDSGTGVLGSMSTEHEEYRNAVKEDLENAGIDAENYNIKVKEELDKVKIEVDETKKETEKMSNEGKTAYENLSNSVAAAQEKISPLLADLEERTKALAQAHLALIKALEQKVVDPNNVVTTTKVTIEKTVTEYDGSGSSSSDSNSSSSSVDTPTGASPSDKTGSTSQDRWDKRNHYEPIDGSKHRRFIRVYKNDVFQYDQIVGEEKHDWDGHGKCNKCKYKRADGGCFDKGTKIILSDLTLKNIEDVQINDLVMAYNEEENIFEACKVTKSYIHHNTPRVIQIKLSNNTILNNTPGHPILTAEGWKSRDIENSLYEHNTIATWLNIGDTLIGYYDNPIVLDIKEKIIGNNYDTYNIEVEKCHTFIADGIVVHNVKANQASGGYVPAIQGPHRTSPLPGRLVSGATGMYVPETRYTGEWGADGRLAILHEKELVLNKSDTTNMLATIETVRKMSENLDLQTSMQQGTLINKTNKNHWSNLNDYANSIQQDVHINAQFPEATDRNEIQLALTQLMEQSLQYAYRNNY